MTLVATPLDRRASSYEDEDVDDPIEFTSLKQLQRRADADRRYRIRVAPQEVKQSKAVREMDRLVQQRNALQTPDDIAAWFKWEEYADDGRGAVAYWLLQQSAADDLVEAWSMSDEYTVRNERAVGDRDLQEWIADNAFPDMPEFNADVLFNLLMDQINYQELLSDTGQKPGDVVWDFVSGEDDSYWPEIQDAVNWSGLVDELVDRKIFVRLTFAGRKWIIIADNI